MRALKLAFLVPGMLLGLALTVLSFVFVFTVVPAPIVWAAIGLLVLCGVWAFWRRNAVSAVVSEGSLMGRQSSKEGLL